MVGAGKYDDTCTQVRVQHKAAAVLLAIVGGDKGSGSSFQLNAFKGTPEHMLAIAKALRLMADELEEDAKDPSKWELKNGEEQSHAA